MPPTGNAGGIFVSRLFTGIEEDRSGVQNFDLLPYWSRSQCSLHREAQPLSNPLFSLAWPGYCSPTLEVLVRTFLARAR